MSLDVKNKISNANKGKTVSLNTKLKIANAAKNRKNTKRELFQYDLNYNLLNIWESSYSFHKNNSFGFSRQWISSIARYNTINTKHRILDDKFIIMYEEFKKS